MDGAVSPRKNKVGGSLFLMKVILIASLMAVFVGWVLHRLLGDHIPDGVILIATKECSSLGSTWRNYEGGGGRFIVGVGTASDVRGEGKSFAVGDVGGSYSQDLTESQMPEHSHGRVYVESNKVDFEVEKSNKGPDIHEWKREPLKLAGEGKAHNNVPPYIALYFCKKL